ncbi:MAG: sarcosine oxidase subunit delta [Pseudomonadota bacterium]
MLLINCPYCGARPETEFHYGGEAHVSRPADPSKLNDEEWAEFLFVRDNKKGFYKERWVHSAGCRRWFNVLRNTHTHEIVASYKVSETVRVPKATPIKKATAAKSSGTSRPTPAKRSRTAEAAVK